MAHRIHHPKNKNKTTVDSKLKEFMEDYSPSIQYIMPEKDYDGEDMFDHVEAFRNNELSDSDYIEWCETVDDCVKYITPKSEHQYVLTITFNRCFHTLPTMFNIEKHLQIIKYYIGECLDVEIEEWYGALEYHKKPMGVLKRYPPHYHFILGVNREIEPFELQKTQCAFWRHFGKVDFKPVEDDWARYMCKNNPKRDDYGEFLQNIKQYKKPHLFIVD